MGRSLSSSKRPRPSASLNLPSLPPCRHFLPLTLSPRDCAAINEKPLALRDGIGGQVTKLWTCLREGASAKAGQNLLSVVY